MDMLSLSRAAKFRCYSAKHIFLRGMGAGVRVLCGLVVFLSVFAKCGSFALSVCVLVHSI